MLRQVLGLNQTLVGLKNKKWKIEEQVWNLEKRIAALEKKLLIVPEKDTSTNLDFRDKKIPALKKRIDELKKRKVAQAEAKKFEEEYEQITSATKVMDEQLAKPNTEITQLFIKMRAPEEIVSLRTHVSKLHSTEAYELISSFDAILTMPVLLTILNEIQMLVESEMMTAFFLATGKKVDNFTSVYESIEKKLKKVADNDKNEIAEAVIDKVVAEIKNEFWANLNFSKFQDEAAFQRFNSCFNTVLYFRSVYETYKFTDNLQLETAEDPSKHWLVKLKDKAHPNGIVFKAKSLNGITNPFRIIGLCASKIHVISGIEDLLHEVHRWVKGLYLRSFNQVPDFLKDANNNLTPLGFVYACDEDCRKLNEHKKPLTKMLMADLHKYHYRALAALLDKLLSKVHSTESKILPVPEEAIQPILQETSQPLAAVQEQTVVAAQPAATVLLPSAPQPTQAAELPISSIPTSTQVANLPEGDDEELKQLKLEAINQIISSNRDDIEKILSAIKKAKEPTKKILSKEFLDRIEKEPMETKFTALIVELTTGGCSLSDKQISLWDAYKDVVSARISSYSNAMFSSKFKPNINLGGLGALVGLTPAHMTLMNDKKDEINASDDVIEQFKIIFMLWKELKSKASVDGCSNIEAVLNTYFSLLRIDVEPTLGLSMRPS